jgi:uncharacterized protein YdhG (YjbR/CyaY superfamily)
MLASPDAAKRGVVMTNRPRSIDEYLNGLSAQERTALQKVRRAIHAAAPGALIAGFRAAAKHCAYHPMSGATVATLKRELVAYDTSPGRIRFAARAGFPAALVRRLVKARIAE